MLSLRIWVQIRLQQPAGKSIITNLAVDIEQESFDACFETCENRKKGLFKSCWKKQISEMAEKAALRRESACLHESHPESG
jgi:hypothetical protein